MGRGRGRPASRRPGGARALREARRDREQGARRGAAWDDAARRVREVRSLLGNGGPRHGPPPPPTLGAPRRSRWRSSILRQAPNGWCALAGGALGVPRGRAPARLLAGADLGQPRVEERLRDVVADPPRVPPLDRRHRHPMDEPLEVEVIAKREPRGPRAPELLALRHLVADLDL